MKPLVRILAAAAAFSFAAAPVYAENIRANANGTRVSLNTGFLPDPHDLPVTAGGAVDASTVSEGCVGHVASRPNVSLEYRAGELPLVLSTSSEGDTTLVVRAPDGSWHCNDDGGGALNARVIFESPARGRYRVWVGTFGADTAPAVLHVSEIMPAPADAANAPDFTLDPTYGAVELASGFQPDPHMKEISAGGSYNAIGLNVAGCVGFVARAPDYRVNFTPGSSGLPLIFSVTSEADTTLLVNGPGGDWVCDDDSGNGALNPSITFAQPAEGQYDVWVGTFAEGDLQPSTLNVSELTSQ